MLKRGCVVVGWSAAVYLSLALQMALGERAVVVAAPALGAAVAGWMVARLTPFAVVLGAAVMGLATDAAGHGPLGQHLAAFAVSAASLCALRSPWNGRGCPAAVAAGAIAMFDVLCSGLLGAAVGSDSRTSNQIGVAAMVAGANIGALVFLVAGAAWLLSRVVRANRSTRPLEIGNRWRMLTE